ncbi:uncharacterized protein LOC119371747 [Rhipicephalus sanguineus]|uniref:uncharacterized protein LOC119371747 n=1 Tax=Rhipicephalus sanguineus TaxID=34632 RepID=UPI00189583C4|nr:uncharacterized protein LOC119371747 [Rhipicephalus sanguineus]
MHESSDRQNVIEKYLQGLHHHEDGYSHGYLKSDDELKLFERSLAAVNERYAVRTSRDLNKSSKSNVVFSMIHSGCRISLDNVPFRVVKEAIKVCIFGTEYYKKTPGEKKRPGMSHGYALANVSVSCRYPAAFLFKDCVQAVYREFT